MSDNITKTYDEPPYNPDKDPESKSETGKLPWVEKGKKKRWMTIFSISMLVIISAILILILVKLSHPTSSPLIIVPELTGTWEADWEAAKAYEKNPPFSYPLSPEARMHKANMEICFAEHKRITFEPNGRLTDKPKKKCKAEYTLHSRSNGNITLSTTHYIYSIFSSKKRTIKGGMQIQLINPNRFALRITRDHWMIYNKVEE